MEHFPGPVTVVLQPSATQRHYPVKSAISYKSYFISLNSVFSPTAHAVALLSLSLCVNASRLCFIARLQPSQVPLRQTAGRAIRILLQKEPYFQFWIKCLTVSSRAASWLSVWRVFVVQ